MLALTLLLACAAPDATPDSAAVDSDRLDSGDTDPGDTGAALTTAPPPSWDAATAAARAQALLDVGLPDAASVLADWRALFEGAGLPCPGMSGTYSIASPFEGCLATDGRIWAGYAVYTVGHDADLDLLLEADAYVTEADGRTFLAAGKTRLLLDTDGTFTSTVVGTWGGSQLPDWTADQPSVAMYTTGDAASADFYGGVSHADDAVYIADGRWDAARCVGGTGVVSIRDPGGWWYTLTLDADCGGCGTVRYDGAELGVACLDLGGIVGDLVARVEGG